MGDVFYWTSYIVRIDLKKLLNIKHSSSCPLYSQLPHKMAADIEDAVLDENSAFSF